MESTHLFSVSFSFSTFLFFFLFRTHNFFGYKKKKQKRNSNLVQENKLISKRRKRDLPENFNGL